MLSEPETYISVFVTNLGKYNEGELVGEWVSFPISKNDFSQVLKRIGIGSADEFGQPYEEIFISDIDCSIPAISELLSEYESFSRLNYLASCIDKLNPYEFEKYKAVLESACDSFKNLNGLIDLTFNLDCYDYRPDIKDEYELGHNYAFDSGLCSETGHKGLIPYIDFEALGRDIMIDENGAFSENGYIRRNEERWIERFGGGLDEVPEEWRVY